MPKKIFVDFKGGLATRDRNIPDNQFFVGENVDVFLQEGYILPSPAATDIDSSNSRLRGVPVAGIADSTNSKVYVMTDNGDLHQISINGGFNTNFDGSSHAYYAIGSWSGTYGGAGFNDMVIYDSKVSSTSAKRLIYAYNTAAHAYLGTYPLSGTVFSDTYVDMTTTGFDGSANTSYQSPHPILDWQSYLWVGNGRYLSKFDGQGSTDGTLTAQALDLGTGWEITALFPTSQFIGICAWKKGAVSVFTECRVFFWDGTSSTYNSSTPIKENKITAAVNYNGDILLATSGRNYFRSFGRLATNGFEIINKFKATLSGAEIFLQAPSIGSMSVGDNMVFMGDSSGYSAVAQYGNDYGTTNIFTLPFFLSANAGDYIGMIRQVGSNNIYIGWKDATNSKNYLYTVNPNGTTKSTALYKSGYIDLGQKVRINYVKFYFKALASGDAITPTLDVDYGTSKTLKDPSNITTISFANDGATTSKRFNAAGLECQAFRVCLNWTAGATAFSKIVVDYSYTPDDY